MKRVLVIAYYFPPMGLSGVQRMAKFVKYLPDFGWSPTVLTAKPGGYFAFDESMLAELNRPEIAIEYAASFDPTRFFRKQTTVSLPAEGTRRSLAYLSQFFFIPDNKIGWKRPALARAGALQADAPFDAVLATVPPYTGALIAEGHARRHQLPLIVDYRDDWLGNPRHIYPTPIHRRLHERLERRVMLEADAVITTNHYMGAALAARIEKYIPDVRSRPDLEVISHGYDPADFTDISPLSREALDRLRLLYCGVFYSAQTPDYFLRGLAGFLAENPAARSCVEASFIGLVPAESERLITSLRLNDVVRLEGYQPHHAVVSALQSADVLWMTLGRGRGQETISTGKLYEYMGARKSILGLVPEGAERDTIEAYGASFLAPPDDVPAITRKLHEIYKAWKERRLPAPDESYVTSFDRTRLTEKLAGLLDRVSEIRIK